MPGKLKEKAKGLVLGTFQKWMFQESKSYQLCECYLEVMTRGQKKTRAVTLGWQDKARLEWKGKSSISVFKQKKGRYLSGICGGKSYKKNEYIQVKEIYKTVFLQN